MKKYVLIYVVLLIIVTAKLNAQVAVVQIRLETPESQTIVVGGERFKSRPKIRTMQDDQRGGRTTDSTGYLVEYQFDAVTKISLRYVNFFVNEQTYKMQYVLVKPNDTLVCRVSKGKLLFEGEGSLANINRFLHKSKILSVDSLQRRPLVRNVPAEMYRNLMRDMADQQWAEYQTTQTQSDETQNAFVQAAIEGQYYQRVLFYEATKEWADELFNEYVGLVLSTDFQKKRQDRIIQMPPLRIIAHEDALLSSSYRMALLDYLGIDFQVTEPSAHEPSKMMSFYDKVEQVCPNLPRTREELLRMALMDNSFWAPGADKNLFIERFEKDFPASTYLNAIKQKYWSSFKAEAGLKIPPLPLFKQDSSQTKLQPLLGKKTLLLLWNTWEDSCQAALVAFSELAAKNRQPNHHFVTLCTQNRFDSWKDILAKHSLLPPQVVHFYADYAIAEVLKGMFTSKRPLVILVGQKGEYLASGSPFDRQTIDKWLKE